MVNVYVYAADLYCFKCGEDIRARLNAEGKAPEDPNDERTYDSNDYPKGPYGDGGGESDSPAHCGAGEACLQAFTVRERVKMPVCIDAGGHVLSRHDIAEGTCIRCHQFISRHAGRRQSRKVGAWLENPLTPEGVDYVRQAIARDPHGAITRRWREWYAEELAG